MPASGDIVVDERRPGVWWLTINRASKHNALARGVLGDLGHLFTLHATDPRALCIIITGAGNRFFAAGGDLVELASVRDEAATREMVESSRSALDAIRNAPVPVLAFLNGDAIGGGAELAVACDMRLQLATARIGFIQAKLAITSAWGGGPDLCRLVGPSRAMRMMSRCELIDADQALAWGLADAIIRPESAETDVWSFVEPMTKAPPQVLRGIKAQTRGVLRGQSYQDRLDLEKSHLVNTWLHDDHWAYANNVLSKAKP